MNHSYAKLEAVAYMMAVDGIVAHTNGSSSSTEAPIWYAIAQIMPAMRAEIKPVNFL